MPLPAKVTFVTFDVYGTLIDWETGVYEAFSREAERDGFTIDEIKMENFGRRTATAYVYGDDISLDQA